MTAEALLWPVLLGVLGLVFGSFIATLAIRWPQGRGVSKGRSACDDCGRALSARELVPVVSFVVQRGRCRGCGVEIRRSHLVIELVGCAIGVAAALVAPGLPGLSGAVFGWLLLSLATLDFAALWLPNVLTGALAAAGMMSGLVGLSPSLEERLIGGVAGFAALWLVATGYRRFRGRQGLGEGDAKLFGAIGLWLGWQALPMTLLVACLIGLAAVLALMSMGRRVTATDRLPFGVMLAAAAFAMWIGAAIG